MKTTKTFLIVTSAVLALSTALRAGAEPSATDAQGQARRLLTAASQFHAVAVPDLRAATDVQSQARAIVTGQRNFLVRRVAADNGIAPVGSHTQLAHRGAGKNADAQSMAATVLLGRGA